MQQGVVLHFVARGVACAGLLAAGCAGQVEAKVTVKPPPAVAVAVEPEPGATGPVEPPPPASPPPAPTVSTSLRAEVLGVNGEIVLGADGTPQPSSSALLDQLAAALAKRNDIELVAVAAFVAAGGDGAVRDSQTRADAVAAALAARGVDEKRLQARGFGSRCGGADRIELLVVRRSGRDSGVLVGCR
jgi:outer membrane protein OmpA-like peptidoglycan-associated protein